MSTRCQLELFFFDAAGTQVSAMSGEVMPGEIAQLDFAAPPRGGDPQVRAQGTALDRFQLRAVVKGGVGPSPFFESSSDGAEPNPCAAPVLASVEVFNAQTGATSVLMNPAVLVGFNPQPEPPGAPAP